MAGKAATISDLFAPMQSIKTCMDSHGTAITDNLVQLNQAVMSCATSLTASEKLIKDATKDINKTIADSFASFNDMTQKQISAAANTTKIETAISSSITSSVSGVKDVLDFITGQLVEMSKQMKPVKQEDPNAPVVLEHLTKINQSALNCSTSLSVTGELIKNAADDIAKTIKESIASFNDITQKQVNAAANTTSGISNAISGSVTSKMSDVGDALGIISSQLDEIIKTTSADKPVDQSGHVIAENLTQLNQTVLSGIASVSGFEKLVKDMTDAINNTIKESIDSINDITQKQIGIAANTIASAIETTKNSAVSAASNAETALKVISSQLSDIGNAIAKYNVPVANEPDVNIPVIVEKLVQLNQTALNCASTMSGFGKLVNDATDNIVNNIRDSVTSLNDVIESQTIALMSLKPNDISSVDNGINGISKTIENSFASLNEIVQNQIVSAAATITDMIGTMSNSLSSRISTVENILGIISAQLSKITFESIIKDSTDNISRAIKDSVAALTEVMQSQANVIAGATEGINIPSAAPSVNMTGVESLLELIALQLDELSSQVGLSAQQTDPNGHIIAENLMQLNKTVLSCASSLSTMQTLVKDSAKGMTRIVKESLASLNKMMQKQVVLAAGSTTGIAGSISTSITSGISSLGEMLGLISNQVAELSNFVRLIERYTDPKGRIVDKVREKFSLTDRMVSGKTIKAPNVKGGDGVGELAKSLAAAARDINGIKYTESISIKKKAKRILGGLLDLFSEYEDQMGASQMKKYLTAVKSLTEISAAIGDVAENMAETLTLAPFAKMGSKSAKKIISNILTALRPIDDAKSLAKTKTAVHNLKDISEALVEFEAKMALTAVLGIPAMLGTAMSGVIIRETLWAFRPLGDAKNTAKFIIAARNLQRISKSMLEFNAAMALNSILGIPAIIGTALSGIVIREALAMFRPLGDAKTLVKTEIAARNLQNIAKSVMFFTASMSLVTILGVPAMTGTALAALVVREALIIIRPLGKVTATRKTVLAAANLATIATSILKFTAAMALTSILAIPAAIGVGMSFLLIKGSTLLFKNLGNAKNSLKIRNAALNVELMSMSMIMFTLSLLATTMISKYILTGGFGNSEINPTNVIALGAAVGTDGLMLGGLFVYKTIGSAKSVKDVLLAGAAISVMAGSFMLFTLSLLVSNMVTKAIVNDSMKDGKFDVTDILAVAMIAPTYGLMLASYAVYKKIGAPESTKKVLNGGLAILMMSLGFMTFSLSLLVAHQVSKSIVGDIKSTKDIWTLVMDVGVLALMLGSYYLYKKIGNPTSTKEVLAGGLSVIMMSLGFVIFSSALYLTHNMIGDMWKTSDGKMAWGDLFKTVAVFGLMYASMLIFKAVGNNFTSVAKGAGGVALMAVGIGLFGFGLSFFTSAIKGETAGHLMMIPVLLGTLGVEFAFLGGLAAEVALGSAAVLAMSVAVGAFGYGLSFFVDSLKGVEWRTIGKMAALIGIFGAEFALLGIPPVAGAIALGSAAVAAFSASLYVFGQSVKSFVDPIKSLDANTTWKMAKLIGGFGLEFAMLGAPIVAPLIIRGAAAMTVVGKALKVLSEAMKVWSETKMDETKLNMLCTSVDRIKLAFQGYPDGEKPDNGFWGNLKTSISGAINAPFDNAQISKTANALAIASTAITILSKALKTWADVNISDDSMKLLCTSVDRIKLAFQGYPDGQKPEDKGLFARLRLSDLAAAPFDLLRMKTTALGLLIAGDAIKKLAKGLSTWEESNLKTDSIDSFITIIVKLKDAFGQIGADDREKSSSLLKSIIGVDFSNLSQTSVERGISLTKKMGKAIHKIAEGLEDFQEGVGSKFRNQTEVEKFATSVGNIVTSLSSVFAQLVSEDKIIQPIQGKQGLFGTVFTALFGEHIKQPKSKIAEGIKTVKDLGSTIKDIAQGMKEFADIIPKNNHSFITDVAAGLSALLQGIQEPLVAFGTTDESFTTAAVKAASVASKYSAASASIHEISANVMNFNHHKVDVAHAMEHVGQIGDLVKGLAEGAKILADPKLVKSLGKAGTITDDFIVGDDAQGAIGNIQKLVCSNLAIFLQLGKKMEEVGVYEAFHDEIVQNTRRGGKVVTNKTVRVSEGKKSYIAMAVDSAVGIGQVITSLAEGYKNMNQTFPTNKEMTEGVARVGNAITSIMTAFSVIGFALTSGVPGQFYDAAPGNPEMSQLLGKIPGQLFTLNMVGKEPFEKAGESISTIVNSLSSSFKTIADSKTSITDFHEIGKKAFESLGIFVAMSTLLSTHAEGVKTTIWDGNKATGYNLHILTTEMMNTAVANAGSVKSVMNSITKIFTNLNKLPKDSASIKASIVESAINLTYVAKAIGDHNEGDTIAAYTDGKGIAYKLRVFDNAIASSAASNSKFIHDTVLNLSKSTEYIPRLKANYGNTFVDFSNKMAKGMNTLAGASKSIQHSTTFINTLMEAVKERVFDNISMNTERIASSINSIDNDIFEPYAQMIAALGTMTDKHSEFIKMQKELYELLEKIIDKINGAGNYSTESSAPASTTGTANPGTSAPAAPAPRQDSKPLTAKLVPSTVKLTYGNFITEFESMLNRVKDSNTKPSR